MSTNLELGTSAYHLGGLVSDLVSSVQLAELWQQLKAQAERPLTLARPLYTCRALQSQPN